MKAEDLMLNDKVYICLDNGKKVKCEVKGLNYNEGGVFYTFSINPEEGNLINNYVASSMSTNFKER